VPGFGVEPPGRGPRGLRADQPSPVVGDDIQAIRKRYCGPKTLSIQNFAFAANQGARFDLTGTPINAIILTVSSGQANLYIGDYTSGFGKAAVVPHIVGSGAIIPISETLPLPPAADYIFTLQEGAGGTTTGTIIFLYQ
jgi:hypothetical protein